ncbi:MAG: sugar-binding protein [Planctomycetaceae bacterium]
MPSSRPTCASAPRRAIRVAAIFRVSGLLLAALAAPAAPADSLDDWQRMKRQTPRSYVAARAEAPPAIDGTLDDAAWEATPWTDDFVDIEGDARPAPTHGTRAKMLWDDDCLYIAAQLDEPDVWATIRDHDAVIFQDDDFEVFIDPDGDNHHYYEFEMNALNTGWDLFLPKPYKDGGKADDAFELAGLRTAVAVQGTLNDPGDTDRGWSIEIAIPWKAFDRPAGRAATAPAAGERWRVGFSRVDWLTTVENGRTVKVPNRPEHNWIWSAQGIVDMHRPERWGSVVFSDAASTLDVAPAPDPDQAVRDLLMEIYHRQRSHQGKHGSWAADLAALGMDPEAWKPAGAVPRLAATAEGFTASLDVARDGRPAGTWRVEQDSRLTFTPAGGAGERPAAQRDDRADAGAEVVPDALVAAALGRAGANRAELERAIRDVPEGQREAMRFLVAHMPRRDLASLSADYLLENTALACRALDEAPWGARIPRDVFLNDVLPYASINERRDRWRKDFREKCLPLVEGARTPGQAAAMLNQKIYGLFNVRYSTKRKKADQSPHESIESGLATCSGLAVLLIDACRAVGVPARFCGTPLWADRSGNHSWVEVWDDGWHFTGAAEPAGDALDAVWFGDRAAAARRDDPLHAIYATSFRRTPQHFPLVWAMDDRDVSAVNVTDRYTSRAVALPEGQVPLRFRAVDGRGERVAARVEVVERGGAGRHEITTNDERFDANDHRTIVVDAAGAYDVSAEHDGRVVRARVERPAAGQVVTLAFAAEAPAADEPAGEKPAPDTPAAPADGAVDRAASAAALEALSAFLALPEDGRGPIGEAPFAGVALAREDAARARELLVEAHARSVRESRAAEMKEGRLRLGDLEMPFTTKVFGAKPPGGRSMVISMHGGGGAPKAVNDSQWENQKRLYTLEEGVYVVPRAPTDTWNLWHQDHIDPLFDRLIENLIVFEEVDPDRVYIMGYSAGGDGVYQLAPRLADRLAAAAMMAGHPNETSPLGLRNLPFTIHMGGQDAAFGRNQTAAAWETMLAELRAKDPEGYPHQVTIHADKGHWMDREDAVAVPWMMQFRRDPFPKRVVWKQDDVTHDRFYWLALDAADRAAGSEIVATRDGQSIDVASPQVRRVRVLLNDAMADLDLPVVITSAGRPVVTARARRTIGTLARTLAERGDPRSMYDAEVAVELPAAP